LLLPPTNRNTTLGENIQHLLGHLVGGPKRDEIRPKCMLGHLLFDDLLGKVGILVRRHALRALLEAGGCGLKTGERNRCDAVHEASLPAGPE
jgi:hypothetical protein